jgi:hypothetical protein
MILTTSRDCQSTDTALIDLVFWNQMNSKPRQSVSQVPESELDKSSRNDFVNRFYDKFFGDKAAINQSIRHSESIGGDVDPPASPEQVVDWDADDDNGSALNDYIPEIRDYQAGYSPNEDDVLPFPLVLDYTEGPADQDAISPKRFEWKLNYSRSGEGDLKFWDTPSKLDQLSPSSNWQFTPNFNGPPFPQWEGVVPDVYVEGTQKSNPEKDLAVKFDIKMDTWEGGTFIFHYQQVKETVAPVIKNMWVSTSLSPYFDNRTINNPNGDGTALRVLASVEIQMKFVKGNNGKVGFIQFQKDSQNDLPGNIAKLLTNGDRYAVNVMPVQEQQTNNYGPNYAFPFLDSSDDSKPYYVRPVNEAQQDGAYIIRMNDNPGTTSGSVVMQIRYHDEYWTYGAWVQNSVVQGVQKQTVAALTLIRWTAKFDFDGWQNPPGYMTQNNSTLIFDPLLNANPSYYKMGADAILPIKPSFANLVVAIKKI